MLGVTKNFRAGREARREARARPRGGREDGIEDHDAGAEAEVPAHAAAPVVVERGERDVSMSTRVSPKTFPVDGSRVVPSGARADQLASRPKCRLTSYAPRRPKAPASPIRMSEPGRERDPAADRGAAEHSEFEAPDVLRRCGNGHGEAREEEQALSHPGNISAGGPQSAMMRMPQAARGRARGPRARRRGRACRRRRRGSPRAAGRTARRRAGRRAPRRARREGRAP